MKISNRIMATRIYAIRAANPISRAGVDRVACSLLFQNLWSGRVMSRSVENDVKQWIYCCRELYGGLLSCRNKTHGGVKMYVCTVSIDLLVDNGEQVSSSMISFTLYFLLRCIPSLHQSDISFLQFGKKFAIEIENCATFLPPPEKAKDQTIRIQVSLFPGQ